ncbi:TolC family protein [Agriterribacter humi]|uniref:TolC family protein n=1 Tax=Agriterribacter humi TaxID=1104781 RepID=UPI0012648B50|nr:TolC family protein [Agriterribacter humi]
MIITLNKAIGVLFLLTPLTHLHAQTKQLTIDSCYSMAKENYPLIKKQDLIAKSSQYSLENASKFYLPQLTVNGQATYQSQTISFSDALPSIPGISFPTIDKDQYKIQAELSQSIYDGGVTKHQKALIRANEQIQQQSLEVNLNTLKDRVTQIYFSVLLMNEQLKQNEIRKTDLQGALNKANAAFINGTGFRSNVDELKAAIINIDMTAITFRANRNAFMDMLALLIGRPVDESTILVLPEPLPVTPGISRPELKYFDLQKKSFDIQEQQLRSAYTPKLSAFVQGAYGRPTLNIIENKFGPWWIAGIRLNWSAGSLYSLKNNRHLLEINRQNVDTDKETFLFNTRLTLSQQNADIKKYSDLLEQDNAVAELLTAVVQSAKAQLDNGVITVHEYIAKLNEENLAKQARIVHNIQLLQAQYNFKNTSGN